MNPSMLVRVLLQRGNQDEALTLLRNAVNRAPRRT